MPRIARVVVPEYPHHIIQRGNYRQNVFLDDSDKRQYLSLIAEYSQKYYLNILAYCLMDNHVHFIVIPKNVDSMAKTFSVAHTLYSQYFNKKMNAFGHLWQGRFYSCVLDENHLIAAGRYVERNPVRVGMVKKSVEYVWSSARSHVDGGRKDIIDTSLFFKYIEVDQDKWGEFIEEEEKSDEINTIRKHTMTGRPLGGTSFIQKLEKMFGTRLHALPIGRPFKTVIK